MAAKVNAEVIAVYPNKVKVKVTDLVAFANGNPLRIGSFIEIADNENAKLLAVVENFSIEVGENGEPNYLLEANPLGSLKAEEFVRGGDELAIPPKDVRPALPCDVKTIYSSCLKKEMQFTFCKLVRCDDVVVPVHGDKFFNKHIAIVGSTGSGKSHTVSRIIQKAVSAKNGEYPGLNNSHVVIFDIHSEYKSAFPDANNIGIQDLVLPYWLLNSEELEEFFLDTEGNDHNQRNILKEAIITSRKNKFTGDVAAKNKIHYDSALFFDIDEVLTFVRAKNEEEIDTGETYASGDKKGQAKTTKGSLNGKLTNFVSRLENKTADKRLSFLLGEKSKKIGFSDALKILLGFQDAGKSNVTILDVSAVPFEVLSITVSLVSRMLFDFGYYLKKNNNEGKCKTPLLLVYEEAHKYVPKSDLAKYRSSKNSIERIAKEGRKYGVTMIIASQRPSEISETIFSQCNNFIAMRLTNPEDQGYVKRLLPDSLGNLTDTLPSLKAGEALLIGDSVIMPSLVIIDPCELCPSSSDVPYYELWKQEWINADFESVIDAWRAK
jgi:DNA helicase HerA-like ATPase